MYNMVGGKSMDHGSHLTSKGPELRKACPTRWGLSLKHHRCCRCGTEYATFPFANFLHVGNSKIQADQ